MEKGACWSPINDPTHERIKLMRHVLMQKRFPMPTQFFYHLEHAATLRRSSGSVFKKVNFYNIRLRQLNQVA